MSRPQPRSTRTDTLIPYATLYRARKLGGAQVHVIEPAERHGRGTSSGADTLLRRRLGMAPLGGGEMVGARGFEPPTSCSNSRHSTRLSYAPDRGKPREPGGRSEARRGGKECVSTCKSRWSPLN